MPAGTSTPASSIAKSCETIPEGNELEFETISEVSGENGRDEDGTSNDLLSIDRVSKSAIILPSFADDMTKFRLMCLRMTP